MPFVTANPDIEGIPFDVPVLAKFRGESVPVMVTRPRLGTMDYVEPLLSTSSEGYGWKTPIADLEAWIPVQRIFDPENDLGTSAVDG
jgi:hypothetical protein